MLLLDVHVLTESAVTLRSAQAEVTMIPFTGTVDGLLQGVVEPGGCDTQTVDETGARRMSARYMLSGTLFPGTPQCRAARLYVENTGWFPGGKVSFPFRTTPVFITDDAEFRSLLAGYDCHGEGVLKADGLHILFYGDERTQ